MKDRLEFSFLDVVFLRNVRCLNPNGYSTKDANLPDHSFRDENFMLGG